MISRDMPPATGELVPRRYEGRTCLGSTQAWAYTHESFDEPIDVFVKVRESVVGIVSAAGIEVHCWRSYAPIKESLDPRSPVHWVPGRVQVNTVLQRAMLHRPALEGGGNVGETEEALALFDVVIVGKVTQRQAVLGEVYAAQMSCLTYSDTVVIIDRLVGSSSDVPASWPRPPEWLT